MTNGKSLRVVWSFTDGELTVNSIVLLDPFVLAPPIRLGVLFIKSDRGNTISSQSSASTINGPTAYNLSKALCDLLTQYYTSSDCQK